MATQEYKLYGHSMASLVWRGGESTWLRLRWAHVRALPLDITFMFYFIGYSAQISCIYFRGCWPIYVLYKMHSTNIFINYNTEIS